MPGTPIRARFLHLYPQLRDRLARRLGSADVADDALNETFLKVDRLTDDRPIQNASGYLFRMAMNTASDQRRAAARLVSASEIDDAMAIADTRPDALQSLEGRAALAVMRAAIAALTPRRRQILEAVRMQGQSCKALAIELGLSRRTVEIELRHALDQCAAHLRKNGFDYATPRDDTSVN